MTNKYKLTSKTKTEYGITLYRIEALKDFGGIKKGDKGGWIEKEENLSQVSGNAWVYGDTQVSGDAQVSEDAWVYGNAQVYGNARVYGNAQVSGNARVFGDTQVFGNARVSEDARVYGNAQVYGNARVYKQKLIGGYFYHTKQKSEKIESIDTYDEGYETLCSEPKLAEEEKPAGKKVKIKVADGQVIEGELLE